MRSLVGIKDLLSPSLRSFEGRFGVQLDIRVDYKENIIYVVSPDAKVAVWTQEKEKNNEFKREFKNNVLWLIRQSIAKYRESTENEFWALAS